DRNVCATAEAGAAPAQSGAAVVAQAFEPASSRDFPVPSSQFCGLATRKSPELADRNVCATAEAGAASAKSGAAVVAQAFEPAGSRDFPVPCSQFCGLATGKSPELADRNVCVTSSPG